jgi:cytochrome b-561 domain-containing protein 2
MLSGISALFSIELRKKVKPIYSKFIHTFLTLVSFSTGMVSIVIAYYTKSWLRRDDPGEIRFWIAAFTIVTILITVIAPLKTMWHQLKSIFKR